MDSLIEKVQTVAKELDQIRDELYGQGTGKPEPLDLQLLNSFKTSVDHMRHLLWAYIEAMTNRASIDTTIQQYRLQRATEMLRQLRQHGPVEPTDTQSRNFLHEVEAIADSALERYAGKRKS